MSSSKDPKSGGIIDTAIDLATGGADSAQEAMFGWGELILPGWLSNLKDVSGTLVAFGRDPRGFILGTIAVFLLEQVLGFVTAIFGFILRVFDLLAGIPGTISSSLIGSGQIIASGFWTVGGAVYWPLLGLINALGWTAPIVFALLFVLLLETAETLSLPFATATSDLLGAIPVVGSILDAMLTFVIGVARRLGGGS